MELNKNIFITLFLLLCSSVMASSPSNIFKGLTSIKEPFELRDPFRPAKIEIERGKTVVGKISSGVYSNIPVLGDIEIEEMLVVGVIIGKERRAFVRVKGKDNTTYTIKLRK